MLVAIIQSDFWEMKKYDSRNHYDNPIANTK